MNILSYNIRVTLYQEGGSPTIDRNEHFEVCLLQETKMERVKEEVVCSLWGGKDVEWIFKAFQGRLG